VGAALRRQELPDKAIVEADYIEHLKQLIATEYVPDSPTHDLTHLARVASLGSQICATEGGDKLIVASAAWLHDLHRDARRAGRDFFLPPEQMDDRVRGYLAKVDIPREFHGNILEAIHYTDRFSFSDRSTHSTVIEAKILRDADCLDAIGAIGIARAFSFGGAHGIPLWDEAAFKETSVYTQSDRPSSTLQHFHDKLLRLSEELETPTARELGRRRSAYLESFVPQFIEEWREDMASSTSVRRLKSSL